MIDAVFINGTVGAGKTTAAEALSTALETASVPHALIDLDQIRRMWPSPADDPFNSALERANLRDVVSNYRRAGARRFILAGVIEDTGAVGGYLDAVGTERLLIVRLRGDRNVLADRIRFRHAGDDAAMTWHLHRLGELDGILDDAGIDGPVFDSSTTVPTELARLIAAAAGW